MNVCMNANCEKAISYFSKFRYCRTCGRPLCKNCSNGVNSQENPYLKGHCFECNHIIHESMSIAPKDLSAPLLKNKQVSHNIVPRFNQKNYYSNKVQPL